jgi:hypothetical protein
MPKSPAQPLPPSALTFPVKLGLEAHPLAALNSIAYVSYQAQELFRALSSSAASAASSVTDIELVITQLSALGLTTGLTRGQWWPIASQFGLVAASARALLDLLLQHSKHPQLLPLLQGGSILSSMVPVLDPCGCPEVFCIGRGAWSVVVMTEWINSSYFWSPQTWVCFQVDQSPAV